VTEVAYRHLVFEEFARKVQPLPSGEVRDAARVVGEDVVDVADEQLSFCLSGERPATASGVPWRPSLRARRSRR
jgi:hypothetical protein